MSINYTYTKEGGVVKFFANGEGTPYVLDINTGVLYGKKGAPLRSFPNGFKPWIESIEEGSNVTILMKELCSGHVIIVDKAYSFNTPQGLPNVSKYLNFMDRLESLGYHIEGTDYRKDLSTVIFDYVIENFKTFAKFFHENPLATIGQFYDNRSIAYCKEKICKTV